MREKGLRDVNRDTTKETEAVKKKAFGSAIREFGNRGTHKNGVHIMFSKNAANKFRVPSRYSRIVYEILPASKNTLVQLIKISSECI